MPNYDFHNSFSPPEFERFVGDILETREGLPFERFGNGADGGIDLRAEKSDGKTTIVQVKRYQNFKQLYNALKSKELLKVNKLKPDRYLLVTSASLSPANVDNIFELFSPYMQSKHDVLGREGLNRLLGMPEYHDIERCHYKLWLTTSNVLQYLLNEEIHRESLNDTKDELECIEKELPLYVQNSSFPEALNLLDKQNFVIVSGPPGIGKTMLGRALVAYHLEKKSYEELVYVQNSIDHAQSLYCEDRFQVFFFDDFWGSVFAKNPNDRNEDKRLLRFLEKIQDRPNKKLVLTTREYVFQQGARRQNYPELARFLSQVKCVVSREKYTKNQRAQILFNHLYFSDLHLKSLTSFVRCNEYTRVIEHRNYTPRLIKTFVRDFCQTEKGRFFFGHAFIEFLDNPYDFYADVLEKQTDTAKLLLLIVLISNDPIRYEDLLKTLKHAVAPAKTIGFKIEVASVPDAIAALEQTFIVTSKTVLFNKDTLKINFLNPSIKDFLLRYLRENIEVYGDVLIECACFFNQLDFVFGTNPDADIDDFEIDETLHGKKILLEGERRLLLKNKLLSEFESLKYSTFDSDLNGRYTCNMSKEDTMVWELIRLCGLFDLELDVDARHFVLEKHGRMTDSLFANIEGVGKPISRTAMSDYPQLTKSLLHHSNRNFDGIIAAFYNSITFTSEFLALGWLGEVFPEQYRQFVDVNRRDIKKKVIELIFDDAKCFSNKDEAEFGRLVDMDMDEVLKMFEMRTTQKFKTQVYEVADVIPPWKEAVRHQPTNDDRNAVGDLIDEYDADKVEQNFESLLCNPTLDNYLDVEEVDELLSALDVPDELRPKVLCLLRNFRLSPHLDLLKDRVVLTISSDAVTQGDFDPAVVKSAPELVDFLIQFQIKKNLEASCLELQLEEVIAQLEATGFHFFFEPHRTTSRQIERQLAASCLPAGLHVEEFVTLCSPFLSLCRQHVRFSSEFLARCGAARHVHQQTKEFKEKFYQNTFREFAENEFIVDDGWWHVFAYFDEDYFFKNVVEPVARKTVEELESYPSPHRFVPFIELLQLDFSIVKKANAAAYELVFSGAGNSILDEMIEFLSFSLSSGDIAAWFASALNEKSGGEKNRLAQLFNARDGSCSNETLSFDFSDWQTTREKVAIVEGVGAAHRFSDMLTDFLGQLRDIIETRRLKIESVNTGSAVDAR